MSIITFGSINMDLVARTPRLPAPGETLTGHNFFTAPGGKGANQSVAAARLGASIKLVGRVGGDAFGFQLRQNLERAGVDTSALAADASVSSGVAIIAVDDTAQNSIIYIPGANDRLDQTDVDRLKEHLAGTEVLLLQLEVPLAATMAAARLGHQQGLTVILDPAPARDLPAEIYSLVNVITPNEVEAGQLVGFPVKTPDEAARAALTLLDRGVKTAIIKMGAQGVMYASRAADPAASPTFLPAFKVEAVDTVAAGDAFNGALAVALAEGQPLQVAVRWGAAAGALSATRPGAQPSMPERTEFDTFLQDNYRAAKTEYSF